jgi:uncharacterized Zn finger protein (UPF0148 family)
MLWTHCPLCEAPLFEPLRPEGSEDVLFTCPECEGLLRLEREGLREERLVALDPDAMAAARRLLGPREGE